MHFPLLFNEFYILEASENMANLFKGIDANTIAAYAAVASAITAFISLLLGAIVVYIQKRNEKSNKRIELFNRRYEIYDCFCNLFIYSQYVEQDSNVDSSENKQLLNYLLILDKIVDDYDLLRGRMYRIEHNNLSREVSIHGGEIGKKSDLELYYIDSEVNGRINQVRSNSIQMIEKGKFCFNPQIVNIMRSYINELCDYINVFKDGSAVESIRDATKLLSCIEKVKRKNVIDIMEKELSVW